MAYTDINSEDRLVQATFAEHLEKQLGWDSVYAWNNETFGPDGTPGPHGQREVVLMRDLRAALARLNPDLPAAAIEEAIGALTRHDFSRSLVQHNQEFYALHPRRRAGALAGCKRRRCARRTARVIDFDNTR